MATVIKIATLVVGVLLGGVLLGVVVGLAGGMLVVVGCSALTMLVRRDWVPVIYNMRSLGVRRWTTGVTALGLALVVFVFTTVLMLASGVHETLKATGSPENAKIIRKGSQNEVQSGLLPEHLRLLSSAPEVAHGQRRQAAGVGRSWSSSSSPQREDAHERRGRHQPQRARRRADGRSSCIRRRASRGACSRPAPRRS